MQPSTDAPKKEREWDRERFEESQNLGFEAVNDEIDFFMDPLVSIDGADVPIENLDGGIKIKENFIKKEALYEIYERCDSPILWHDILLGNSAEDLQMDLDTWMYCRTIADKITKGDIDTYLEAISELAPLDDLLWYGSDFEFGTDNSKYIETEFVIYPEELLKNGENDELLPDYIEAVSLRVARDLFALLPIENSVVHVLHNGKDLFSGVFERKIMESLDFSNRNIKELMKNIRFVIVGVNDEHNLQRLCL